MQEILKEKSAATFYKKVMAYVQKYDNNFSKLSLYFQKTPTNKLKMGKVSIACCVDALPRRKSDYDASVTWTYSGKSYCLYLEFIPVDLESDFFPKFNTAYMNDFSIKKNGVEYVLFSLQQDIEEAVDKSDLSDEIQLKDSFEQKILFGAPGTGKSYKIDYNLFKDENGNLIGKGIKEIPEDRKFRTTFHPDYDYAQFVGAYKPQKVQCNDNGLLSEEQLAHKLSESFLKRDNSEIDKTSAIVLFGLQYANSLNGKTISQIVKLSGIGDEEYKKANLSAAVKAQMQFSDVDGKITYSFVPQVFAEAYAVAWKQYFDAGSVSTVENQVYLVIEEINRGNCAQIFGDIFQLLDRVSDGSDKGFSQYSIDADYDFADWLKNKDAGLKSVWNQYKDEVGEGKLRLPPNLNILATMNTSDQSLFPMDSAFKRRFDWEYVPISFDGKDAANYQIDIDGSRYSWQNFVEAVNDKILDLTESEDKQLGEFFIKPDNGNIISKERFLGKVMFYLWNEVCKDEHKNGSFFRAKINDNKDFFTFQDLYKKKDLLKLFMDELLKKE